VEIELLSSALILVACISAGVSCMFIARNRGTINKHSRQRIKDFEADIKYLADSKKEEAKEYRQEILRLKSSVNRIKDGPALTEQDIESNSGIGEVLIKKFGFGKYLKYLPKGTLENIEKGIMENKDEIIKGIQERSNNKQAQPGTETQGVQTL
jgi:hypothetical protein